MPQAPAAPQCFALPARLALLVLNLCLILGLAACSSLPVLEGRDTSHAISADADTTFGRTVRGMLESHPQQSGFKTLPDGENAFLARLRMIAGAERSLDVQYYIWHKDLTGNVLAGQLLAAADRGVRVRLLLDDLDTAGKDHLLRVLDSHPNFSVRLFNPFANRSARAEDFVADTARINRRMHNKTLTADNQVSVFGGRNIGDEYFQAGTEMGFGDMDALAVGPIVQEISAQFDLYWNSRWAYPIDAFDWPQPVTAQDLEALRAAAARNLEQAQQSEYAGVLTQFRLAQVSSLAELDFVWSDWLLAYDQPDKVTASEVGDETHLAPKLRQGLDLTRHDLIIVSPYFVPGKQFTRYLTDMVARGVRVRILTNSLQANDVSLVHAGYMRYRDDLVRGGVELYEFRASQERLDGGERTRIGASRSSLHAKFFVFDATYVFVGSFNLDGRSVALNTELGAYFLSPLQASAMAADFDDWALQVAYRVQLDDAGKLQWLTRESGVERVVYKEPDTTWWKRFSTRVLSWIVPEAQL
ncbi:phospholipase D family protein [Mangrovimicrobium sediminis]|nr:phospholipase D family protein [Haliea sp. SAOS-164]